jgi:hypothetical protein
VELVAILLMVLARTLLLRQSTPQHFARVSALPPSLSLVPDLRPLLWLLPLSDFLQTLVAVIQMVRPADSVAKGLNGEIAVRDTRTGKSLSLVSVAKLTNFVQWIHFSLLRNRLSTWFRQL